MIISMGDASSPIFIRVATTKGGVQMGQRFYVDDYFHIGQMHLGSGKPCQDYSFSGVYGDAAFAIVSDGCSAGRHTDVGARVIALSTVNAIQQWLKAANVPINKLSQLVTEQHNYAILKSHEAFNLQLSDMLATCLYVCLTPMGGLVGVQGDGVIAKVYRDGSITLAAYQWDNNTPLYSAYTADNYNSFIKVHGDDLNLSPLQVEYHHHNALGDIQINPQSISLGEAIKGVTQKISGDEVKELSFLVVFTDGVMQVEGIHWKDAVIQLLAFKNVEGEFAKRRMIRFIKDSKTEGKKGPLDDISYAVIRIGHETSGEA